MSNWRIKLIFFFVGFRYWAIAGFIIALVCFRPTILLETMRENKELSTQVIKSFGLILLKTVAIWSLTGGILAIIISNIFITRNEHEHLTSTPEEAQLRFGPKTVAERNAGAKGCLFGILLGAIGTIFILPLLQSELIIIGPLFIRIIIGCIQTFIVTVPILPVSLNQLYKKLNNNGGLR